MRKLMLLAVVLYSCTPEKTENTQPAIVQEIVKPNYDVQMVNEFQDLMNQLDSLKPELAPRIAEQYQWMFKLTAKEQEESKADLNHFKTNLALEMYYTYQNQLLETCDAIQKEAIAGYVNGSSIEENAAREKQYIADHDTTFACSGTKDRITEIKNVYVGKWK